MLFVLVIIEEIKTLLCAGTCMDIEGDEDIMCIAGNTRLISVVKLDRRVVIRV